MIWTITLWMAMQGQAQESPATVHCTQQTMAGATWNICQDNCSGKNSDLPECRQQTPVPAEHVFEIRTTRDLDKPLEGNGLIGCREGFKFIPELRFQSAYSEAYCVRITRELYMDGVKLGTIKGLE